MPLWNLFYYQRRYAHRNDLCGSVEPSGRPSRWQGAGNIPILPGPERKAGTVISSPGGWYDAGDYNKYIVNSAYSIGLMQAIYARFPDYFIRQRVNIPESGNHARFAGRDVL